MTNAGNQFKTGTTALAHAGFVITGIMTTLLGPMLPLLSARWSLNDIQAGYLFTAQFATSIAGVALSTFLSRRYGYRVPLIVGQAFFAVGVVLLVRANWALGTFAICVYGCGQGLTIPASNLLISNLNPQSRAAALNLLNFSWGIGAVGCPFAIAALQPSHQIHWFFYGVAASAVILAVAFGMAPLRAAGQDSTAEARRVEQGFWVRRLVVVLGLLFFIYVGVENSIGGWISSYARRISHGEGSVWAVTPSFFWGALLAGRALAPVVLRKARETNVAVAGLILATSAVALLLSAHSMSWVLMAASLAGLGLSAVFPINIAMIPLWLGKPGERAAGVMFALSSMGGATLPWMVGAISNRFQSLSIGLWVPLVGSMAMLGLYYGHRNSKADAAAA